MNITINKEKIKIMFDMCGIKELEIIVPILKERINKMLKSINDLIEMYEKDELFQTYQKPLDFWYESKKRLQKLL